MKKTKFFVGISVVAAVSIILYYTSNDNEAALKKSNGDRLESSGADVTEKQRAQKDAIQKQKKSSNSSRRCII